MSRLRRWRSGERIAAAGLVLLLLSLPLPWFGLSGDGACRAFGGSDGADAAGGCSAVVVAEQLGLPVGWPSLGIGWTILLGAVAALAFAALVLALRAGPDDPTAAPVTALVLGAALSATALPLVLLRALWLQPGLGLRIPDGGGLPDAAVGLRAGGWAGVVGLLLVTYGLWRAMADERRDAPESASRPVPVRPAPRPR